MVSNRQGTDRKVGLSTKKINFGRTNQDTYFREGFAWWKNPCLGVAIGKLELVWNAMFTAEKILPKKILPKRWLRDVECPAD
jgi:hypothetical protein